MSNIGFINGDILKEKLQSHRDFFVNAYGGFCNMPEKDKSRVDEIDNCIAEIFNSSTIDAVPVVRCFDCKHATLTSEGEVKRCDIFDQEEAVYLPTSFYCGYGERRTKCD